MRRVAASLGAASVGWFVAQVANIQDVAHTSAYLQLVTTLLAIGLFASTYGISLDDARRHVRLVLLAVTVGVVAKAAIIALVMVVVFRRPEYLVLGIAVAQIDPLSVAAQRRRAKMSKGAEAVLRAWASFDDPVTMLLTIYLSAVTLGLIHTGAGSVGRDLLSFGTGVIGNAGFAAAAFLLWRLLQWLHRRSSVDGRERTSALAAAEIILLVLLVAAAVHFTLLLGLAVTGLFYRPAALDRLVGIVTEIAFYAAAAALGLVLMAGIAVPAGLVLGAAAYGAHALVGSVLARGQSGDDRWYLILAQQNGITAIILALLLEADFPGSVAVIAPAIVVINALNAFCNNLREHHVLRREDPVSATRALAPPARAAARQEPARLTGSSLGPGAGGGTRPGPRPRR